MITAGIDIGSVAAKAAIFDTAERRVLGTAVLPTGWNHRQAFTAVLKAACIEAGLPESCADVLENGNGTGTPTGRGCAAESSELAGRIKHIVCTGYGRVAVKQEARIVSEITCHAIGARFLFPQAAGVIDIGGQDSKAVRFAPAYQTGGVVADFIMNDKCAAGTGRFIQMTATLLEMDLEAFAMAAGRGKPASISSMCAVFAESEIIGLLARGVPVDDIAAGVTLSVARRTAALAARLGLGGAFVFTGGLAGNAALAAALSTELGLEALVPERPQIVGALGAALAAAESSV